MAPSWIRFALAMLLAGALCPASPVRAAEPERPLHRFLDVAISPDGTLVASIEGEAPRSGRYPLVRDLVIRHADGSHPVTVALPCGRVAECWPGSLAWTPDSGHLAFALRTPGSHARTIYRVSGDGGDLTSLLSFNGTIIDLRYAPDGRLAMLAIEGAAKEVGATQAGAPITGDLSGPTPEQRIAILEGAQLHWASPPDLFVYEYDWRPDGSGFVGTAAPGDGDNNWWIAKLYGFEAAGGTAKLLYTPPDGKHQLASPHVSRDGKRVAFISGIMSDFGSTGGDLYTLDFASGTVTDITPTIHASVRGIAWRCDGGLLATLLDGAKTELADFGATAASTVPKILWTGEDSLNGERSDEGPSLSCTDKVAAMHESFTSPPEIAVGRVGHLADITHLNAGQTMKLTAKSLTWTSDGATVQGWLLLPKPVPAKPLPMITFVHSGPASAVVPGFSGPGIIAAFLEQGYAVFRPNPRGSYGQGEAFAAANVRDLGAGPLRDILAGIDAAEHAAPIDEQRLGIYGGSYGGYMTMWAVTQTNRFKAGVAAAGISDLLSYYGENGIDESMIPYFGVSVYEDPEAYQKESPITFIRNVKTPTLAYVGAQDIECPAPQTQEFWHALHALGVPSSYVIYPGEGHALRDPAHLADAEQRTLDWFARYLTPPSAP